MTLRILDTCDVPEHDLDYENWDKPIQCGNFRSVRHVSRLKTQEHVSLFVKGPEYLFTTTPEHLRKGNIWWGGPRSGEKYCHIEHPLVEEQVEWEAKILEELIRKDIRAEVPQAIIDIDGKKELVVREIKTTYGFIEHQGISYDERTRRIAELGLVPVDHGGHNVMVDSQGYSNIIDVNRWLWPPHTDEYRRELKQLIQSYL